MTELGRLAAAFRRPPVAGVVLARWRAGETEVAAAGPVEPNAVFELGSVTKVANGLLLADAVVRGELTLETELSDCLDGAPAGIQLGALASHTAGLPRVPWALLRRAGLRNPDPYRGTSVDDLVADLRRVRSRPSGRVSYSNLGAALLGQALAARAGTEWSVLIRERVLAPLGLADELFAGNGGPAAARPHTRRGRPVPAWSLGAYAPAGALRGTVRGALGLSAACLQPPPALAGAVALALTPSAKRGPLEVGLGWHRSPVARDAVAWWHDGGTGGSRSFTGFLAERRTAVAAATNCRRSVDGLAREALVSA